MERKITRDTVVKVTGIGGVFLYSTSGEYSLPTKNGDGGWTPGEWMPEKKPILCQSGYHTTTVANLINWLGPEVYIPECNGESVGGKDKVAHGQIRLLERIECWDARSVILWAADCVDHVLHYFVDACPLDSRPQDAIKATRAYLKEPSAKNIAAARVASDAASDAVRDVYATKNTAMYAPAVADAAVAARAAALVADAASRAIAAALVADADSTIAAMSAAYAARTASIVATRDAITSTSTRARTAALVAATVGGGGNTEEEAWQTERLLQYLNGEINT